MLKSVMNVLMVPVLGFALLIGIAQSESVASVGLLQVCDNNDWEWAGILGCDGDCDELVPWVICDCRQSVPFPGEDPPSTCYCHGKLVVVPPGGEL